MFTDWAAEIAEADKELAEIQLAHSLGKIRSAYRRGQAIDQRRRLLERYSAWLTGEAAKVIDYPKGARR